MKTSITLALLTAGSLSLCAQSTLSAVWMQRGHRFGTARYNGSAGALAALGGDGSSSIENPALMNSSTFGGTEFSAHVRADQTDLRSQGLGLGQAYMAGAWRLNSKARLSVGLAYQRDAWFPNFWITSDQNPQTSAVAGWMEQSNGFSPEQLLANGQYDAYVAYMGYLTEVGADNQYTAYADGLPTYRQVRFAREQSSTSWSVPFAIKSEKFSLGVRIERRDGRTQERFTMTESGFNPSGVTKAYQKTVVDSTRWGQWNIRFGVAAQLTDGLRFSAAVQPASTALVQWDYRNRVTPEANSSETNLTAFELYDDQEFRYQLPTVVQFGLAQTLGTKAAVSAVWVYHSTVDALINSPLNYYDLGRQMANELQAHQQFRLGGEYRLTEAWTARGGVQWSESGTVFDDHSSYQMLGLGLGYQERDWGVDLAFNALRTSGSIQNPGDGQSWDLGANHQRGTVTYRARF
jgi:long-subunit fatty acid transport protein